MNECMNEGRLNYRLISMCVCIYVSLLHDSASGGARTALAPCLETWLAPWLAPRYGSRQPTLYLLAMILLLLLVGALQNYHPDGMWTIASNWSQVSNHQAVPPIV